MSITRRAWRLLRSEAENLYRHISGVENEHPPRHQFEEQVEEDLHQERAHARAREPHGPPRGAGARRAEPEDPIARAYRVLELPAGSDFAAVKAAYRRLMRDYHPDRFANQPEKLAKANRVAAEVSRAYELLKDHLQG